VPDEVLEGENGQLVTEEAEQQADDEQQESQEAEGANGEDGEQAAECEAAQEPVGAAALYTLPDGPEADYIRRIQAARAALRRAETEYEAAKEEARSAKKAWEEAVRHLTEVIDTGPQRLPLFDGPEQEPPAQQADDDWKNVPITTLNLPDGITKALHEAGLNTIGQIAEFTADGNPLTAIPKIGPAKAQKIEAALEKFWETLNQ